MFSGWPGCCLGRSPEVIKWGHSREKGACGGAYTSPAGPQRPRNSEKPWAGNSLPTRGSQRAGPAHSMAQDIGRCRRSSKGCPRGLYLPLDRVKEYSTEVITARGCGVGGQPSSCSPHSSSGIPARQGWTVGRGPQSHAAPPGSPAWGSECQHQTHN